MGLFKRNPFGHILFLKKFLIRTLGLMTHRRFRGFNELKIEGSEIIKDLPDTKVLFISNIFFVGSCVFYFNRVYNNIKNIMIFINMIVVRVDQVL